MTSGELIRSFQVFEGVRVHGTVCSGSFVRSGDKYKCKLVVFGEKKVKIFALVVELGSSPGEVSVGLEVVESLPRLSNWVFDVCFLKVGMELSCFSVGVWLIFCSVACFLMSGVVVVMIG